MKCMKKMIRFALFALLISTVLVSCDKDDDRPSNTPNNTVTNAFLIDGEWRISLMKDDGRDETVRFETYTFKFTADGKLTAVNTEGTVNGVWRTKRDDGRNELEIKLTTTDRYLDELNEDWDIVVSTNTKIELQDDHDDRNDDDVLHFTKK